jgi:glycolate oxidase FAD binding subunit
LRERLLGVQIADPSGRLTRSGGRVVKNVTGYDLHRMHVGAGGAFGIFTEVTLRLEPRPEYRAEVALEAKGWEEARAAWRWLRSDGPEAAFLGVQFRVPTGLELVALCEGDDEPARRAAGDLAAGWQGFGRVQHREPKGTETRVDARGPARLGVALRAAPSAALELYERVAVDERLTGLTSFSACYPQAGEICLELQGRPEDLTAALRAFAESARKAGPAYRVLEEAPPFLPPDVPRWSADPGALRLLARLKRALDPLDVLRPGSYSAAALERAALYFAESR